MTTPNESSAIPIENNGPSEAIEGAEQVVETALTTASARPPEEKALVEVRGAIQRIENVRTFIAMALKPGRDYASIRSLARQDSTATGDEPEKATLLLPGAEKVALYLGLRPEVVVKIRDLGNGHMSFATFVKLIEKKTGIVIGSGQGSCSTMETKYAYRYLPSREAPADDFEVARQKALGLGRFRKVGKKAGEWVWCERIPNPNIHDEHHTCRLISDKRAFVHAVRRTAGLSEEFTQDLEDYIDAEIVSTMVQPPKQPTRASESKPQEHAAAPKTEGHSAPSKSDKEKNAATAKLEDVRIVSDGKLCVVKLAGGFELSTFDEDQFENLKAMKGKRITVEYTTTKKADKTYFNLTDWWQTAETT
jgi:hypothetical protein